MNKHRRRALRALAVSLCAALTLPLAPSPAGAHEGDTAPGGGARAKLIDLADVAVYGKVKDRQTVPSSMGYEVESLVNVEVARPVKGSPGRIVTVRVPGGTTPDGGTVGYGEDGDSLVPGDDVLLFLSGRGPDGAYRKVMGHEGAVHKLIHVSANQTRPNPRFSEDPESIGPGSCTPNPPNEAGFSGFVIQRDANGNHTVWGASSFSYSVQAGFTNINALNHAVSQWNTGGGALQASIGGTTTASPLTTTDGVNTVGWAPLAGSTTLGSAPYRTDSVGRFTDVNIAFNSNQSGALSESPSGSQWDIVHVALHEMGHNLGFGHLNNSSSFMMSCSLLPGDTSRRYLWTGEYAGHKNFYPPNTQGYYMVQDNGAVYGMGGLGSYGQYNANYYGGANGHLLPGRVATDIEVALPTRVGYFILGSDGGVFAFGSGATFKGSAAGYVTGSAVDMTVDPANRHYWILGSDGGVFALPSPGAPFYGSAAGYIVAGGAGIASTNDGAGYWIVGGQGHVYGYGSAASKYYGGGIPSYAWPAKGIVPTASGNGYWIIGANGTAFNFGDAPARYLPGNSDTRKISRDPNGDGVVTISGAGYSEKNGITDYGWGTGGTWNALAATRRPVAPVLNFSASPTTVTARRAQTSTSSLTVSSNETFAANVSFSVSGVPSGVSVSVSPNPVLLLRNGTRTSTLYVTPSQTYLGTQFTLTVNACGQAICKSQQVTVVVTV